MRHGGKILVDQLVINGVETVFTVPGESFLAALDGLHEAKIKTLICRQEGGASMMADAWGKLRGRPGICMVTRGPGAANAMAGLHVAQQDSTPMILFLGMPAAEHEDREAFQEMEVKSVFGTFVKWVAVIRETARIPEYVSRAFHVAQSGRPGPVVLGLPEDMLSALADVQDAKAANPAWSAPSSHAMHELALRLEQAIRPLMIVGGPGWTKAIQLQAQEIARRLELPVATAFRYQDYIDNRHPNFAGTVGIGIDPKLQSAIRASDLLMVVGPRLGEMTTQGYTLIDIPNPKQALVHVHPSPDELGTVYRPDVPIVSGPGPFFDELASLKVTANEGWAARVKELHGHADAYRQPVPTPGQVKLEDVMLTVSRKLPDNAIITNGAGNYAAFLHRYFTYKQFRTCVAPTSGSMGYGLPAAIAAKLAHPDREVINFGGDGCFMMTVQELATALQYDLKIVTVVVNNGMYGTIRMHQERDYPTRVSGTELKNPDFAALARSFGAHGETVTNTSEFEAAFDRARAAHSASIIEVRTDPEAIAVTKTISDLRAAAKKA